MSSKIEFPQRQYKNQSQNQTQSQSQEKKEDKSSSKEQKKKNAQKQEKAEIVIQRMIKERIYSFPQEIFRNKNRFQMILSQPNKNNKFEEITGIFKGRYFCNSGKCWQNAKVKKEQNTKIEEGEPVKHHLAWSSSLSYVTLYYYSYPLPLSKFRDVYNKKKKCQIYYYIELLGQRCQKCDSEKYSYPFFGRKELKRVTKNFTQFIENEIFHRPHKNYKPSSLRKLKDHKQQLCEACQRKMCKQKGRLYV